MYVGDFRSVWLVTFDHVRVDGEPPSPIRLTAKELGSGRTLVLDRAALPSSPPHPVGAETLFVTYDAPASLGCYLALGWPLPARVLDLHAEFRCKTSGLVLEGDFDLAHALAYHGLSAGDDALGRLLEVMLPGISLPHALLRGRYTAAVARMEACGVPIDTDLLTRLRGDWERVRGKLVEQVDCHYHVFTNGEFDRGKWREWLKRNRIWWPQRPLGWPDTRLETFRDMAVLYPQVLPMKELLASRHPQRFSRLAVGSDGRNRCPLRPFASKTGRNQPSTSKFIFGPAAWVRGLIKPQQGRALAYIDFEQQEFGIAAALSKDPAMKEAYRSGDPYLAFARQAGAAPPGGDEGVAPRGA